MKRLGLLLMCVATLAMTSCGLFGSTTSSNAAAVAAGSTCGAAVQGLYGSYRTSKSLNLTEGNNLANALAVANSYALLKQNKDDATYKRSFINGMVASAGGLLTQATATQFVNQLLSSSGLNGVNASNITQTANTVNTLVQLLQVIKQ